MDARRPCPDSALLAAFLDGTLAGYERTAVVSHLADCAECRAVALTVVEFREVEALDALWEQTSAPAPPPQFDDQGVIRWTRGKTRAPALAIGGLAAFVLVAVSGYLYLDYLGNARPSSPAQQAVSTMIDDTRGPRPVEARLSGARGYAPPPLRAAAVDHTRQELIATASNIRTTYARADDAPSRRAVGVAALLLGDLDHAIATLEIASSGAPDDPRIANDLAAAYYERSQRANRPDDLPAALSAVERVLYREPAHLEALFNRALIITALGLRREAEAAWQTYIAHDGNSPWTSEARERLQAADRTATAPAWSALRQALETSTNARDAELAVRHHASAARDYVENGLFVDWLHAAKAHDETGETAALHRLRVMADAFSRHVPDDVYLDFVALVDRDRKGAAREAIISAHDDFLTGIRMTAALRFEEAAPILTRARVRLTEVGSPFSGRAQIELAAIDYYAMRYDAAARRLPPLKAAAQERRYSMLVTRAAWVQGLVAYAMNDFAGAQLAYEEMLSSAFAAGDTDQWLWANGLLGNLHETLGDGPRAWQYRIAAARRFDEAFNPAGRVANLASAAGDALAGSHHAAAVLFDAVLLSSGAVAPNLDVQVRAQRARSLAALGRPAEAERELNIASERLSAIVEHSSQVRVEADLLAAQADVYRETNPARAIAAAQRALTLPTVQRDQLRRARAYLQLATASISDGDSARAELAVTAGLEALEGYRGQQTAESAIRASDAVWQLYTRAAQLAFRRGDTRRAFAYHERGRVRTALERRAWGSMTASVESLQHGLPANTAVVVLAQFENELLTWVVRREALSTHVLAMTASRATGLVAAHVNEMMAHAELPGRSGELFDAIVRPIGAALAGITNVVVVADAPYDRIAFAGLWDRQRDRYLVEEHSVSVSPSVTSYTWALAKSQERKTPPEARYAAFVSAEPERAPRSRADAFARELAETYGAARVRRTAGATAAHFNQEIARGDVVHVTAPLLSNDQYPALSRIVLTDEPGRKYSGSVYGREVGESAPVRAQLVTLENVASARTSAKAEGTVTFARALLAAGVPAVVSPIMPLEASLVEATWVEFHRHYAGGSAAAESLRRAQLAALSQADHRPGPWATLTVFGSTQ